MTSESAPASLPLTGDVEGSNADARPVHERLRPLTRQFDIDSPIASRVLLGAASGLLGYLLSKLMQFSTGEGTIILSLVPVVLASYRCGFVAGTSGTAVAYGLALAFIFPPEGMPVFEDSGQVIRLSIGACVFLMMSLLADWFRRSQVRSQQLLETSEVLRRDASASEHRWRVLADTTPGLVVQADIKGEMLFYNRRYEEYTGLTSEEMRLDPTQVVHPDDVDRRQALLSEVMQTREARRTEWRIRSRAGEYRWHAAYAAPELGPDGRILSIVGGAVDIHDHKVAESAIEAQRALFDTIIAASPVGIGVWDREYRCVTINDALVRMNGVPREQTIGKTPEEYLPDHWAVLQPYFEAALRGEETVGIEMESTNADGEWSAIVASYYPVRSGDEVTGIALVCTDVTPQHTARRELARSEQRYRELSEAMPAMVSLIDNTGHPFYWNKAFFEYTGLTAEQAPNWWTEGLVVQEDLVVVAEKWSRAVQQGLPAAAEVRVRRKDGAYRWHHIRAVPLGRPTNWLMVSTDIDDRRRSEELLREVARETAQARAILDGIVHQAPLGIAFVDLEGKVVHVNETLSEFDGIPTAEHIGRPVAELLPRFWARMEPVFERIRTGQDDFIQFEHTARSPVEPREEHTWNLRWYPVRDDAGTTFGVSVLVEDVTERKRAEAAARFLEETTQHLAASLDYEQNLARVAELAVQHLADICVIDIFPEGGRAVRAATAVNEPSLAPTVADVHLRDWRVNGAPETFAARIMRGTEVFVPEMDEQWLHDHAPGAPELRAAIAVGASSLLSIPLRVKGKVVGAFTLVMARTARRFSLQDRSLARELGTRLAFAVENSRLFDDAQRALAAMQQSDEWLRTANAAKDEFLSLVSHELRTPITTILGNASVIQRHGHQLAPEDLASAVNDIHDDAARLNGIIDNLLALARLERGQQVEIEPLVLRRIARRVVDSHGAEHPDREYRLDFPPETILVEGNAVYIEQVLRNLLSNAERYSPEGSPIDVQATRRDGVLTIAVMDRGVGIDPEEAQDLFEPFFRSSRTAGMKGIGVGLAVCKRLVEFQGGTLSAEPREGGGAVFAVSLPVSNVDDFEAN